MTSDNIMAAKTVKNGGAVVFAARNIKELLRSPVSWAFGLALPVGLFIIMQVIIKSLGSEAAEHVPMFAVSRFTGGVLVFGMAFMSIFAALLISGDRQTSFLTRLSVSPMKPKSFISGYILGVLPIAAAQVVITFIVALCFGLDPTPNILAAILFAMLLSVLFIAIGVIFGSAMSAKSAPPVCSATVQVAALLSGMWFDLDTIGGGFDIFCHVLPFAHGYDLIRYTLAGDYGNVWAPFLVVLAYTLVAAVAAVIIFAHGAKQK